MADIKLVVGLGNPGKKYHKTRHNAGFCVLDALSESFGFSFKNWGGICETGLVSNGDKIIFAKPMEFMNNSGRAVAQLCGFYKILPEEALIVYDDFSLPLGRLRLRKSGSSGGHNGVSSIVEHLSTEEFPRLKLGIGPAPENIDPADFVLSEFSPAEKETAAKTISSAAECVKSILEHGIDKTLTLMSAQKEKTNDNNSK